MKITGIQLENFRNYRESDLHPVGEVVFVSGKNAVGKTNLIESVYLAAIGKSIRAGKEKQLLRWGTQFAYVCVTAEGKFRSHSIKVYMDEKGAKRILLDGIPLTKLGELFGALTIVYFSPEELKLVKDAPSERRRFMDVSLCQQSKVYYYALARYNSVLAQRNKLLKETYDRKELLSLLPLWDGQLAKSAAEITVLRADFLQRLNAIAAPIHRKLTDGAEELQIGYERDSSGGTVAKISEEIEIKLIENRDKDIALQYTSCGVHRDDIKLSVNGIDVRKFGSQGQQRTTVLSLKLAEIEVFKAHGGEAPILLLDDVLSELDTDRIARLLEATAGAQTFITCTDYVPPKDMKKCAESQLSTENGVLSVTEYNRKS